MVQRVAKLIQWTSSATHPMTIVYLLDEDHCLSRQVDSNLMPPQTLQTYCWIHNLAYTLHLLRLCSKSRPSQKPRRLHSTRNDKWTKAMALSLWCLHRVPVTNQAIKVLPKRTQAVMPITHTLKSIWDSQHSVVSTSLQDRKVHKMERIRTLKSSLREGPRLIRKK